jgi:hypothetical protein
MSHTLEIDASARVGPESWQSLPKQVVTTPVRASWVSWTATAIIAIGVWAIVSTYPVFTQTSDEPAHIASGMQLLTFHRYDYEPQHPPLARVMSALPLYLSGIRADEDRKMWPEGNALLSAHGEYMRNLTLARLGVLPFYIVACAFVFLWARRIYEPLAAVGALLLFSTLPLVLAHAGLATTDLGVTAAFAAAMYALLRWQENPSWRGAMFLGAAVAIGMLTKFSFIPFFSLAAAVPLVIDLKNLVTARAVALKHVLIAGAVALLAVWTGYGFSIRPAHVPLLGVMRLPLTEFVRGIAQLGHHFRLGHPSFLLGRTSMDGFLMYFPVALGVKLPISFLVLVLAGTVLALAVHDERSQRKVLGAVITAAAMLAIAMPSSINIGLRHLLPMMPLLALIAAYPLQVALRRSGQKVAVAAIACLMISQVVVDWRQSPDYLSYFNLFAGKTPERILVDSDLDWGQDLGRLQSFCSRKNIGDLTLGYAGSADVSQLDKLRITPLLPNVAATGWVAVSKTTRALSLAAPGVLGTGNEYGWLRSCKPVATVGKSIEVYFVPERR